MPNKWSAPRYSSVWVVRIRQRSGQIDGRVINISRTGLLFVSDRRFRIGDRLELDICTSPFAFFRCTAQVVRERSGSYSHWAYGARFLALMPVDRDILVQGIKFLERSQASLVTVSRAPVLLGSE